MGSTRDFIAATVADAIAPSFRRPVEDIIYETLDRRQIPTRTDFKELRDITNNLRSQTTGATNGIKKLKEGLDDLEESVCDMETQIVDLTTTVQHLVNSFNQALDRISTLEQEAITPTKSKKPNTSNKRSKDISQACHVDGCDAPQRAWGFCAPHYAKWRRGTLDGFVNYDGNITINDTSIAMNVHKGKAFVLKGNDIWIEDECVGSLPTG